MLAVEAVGDCLTPAPVRIPDSPDGRLLRHVACGRRLPDVHQCVACRHYVRVVAEQSALAG